MLGTLNLSGAVLRLNQKMTLRMPILGTHKNYYRCHKATGCFDDPRKCSETWGSPLEGCTLVRVRRPFPVVQNL